MDHRNGPFGCIPNHSQGFSKRSRARRSLGDRTLCQPKDATYDTSDRYRKLSKKDTSQGFMQLLNSGNIDGSFTGSFLYFPQITGISSIIQETLQDTSNNRSIFNSILLSKKPIDISTLLKVFSLLSLLEIIVDWIFRLLDFKTWKSHWLSCQYSFSKHFSRPKKTNGSYSPWNRDSFYKPIPSTILNHFWRSSK